MPDIMPAASQVLAPHVQLIQMGGAFAVSSIVYATAKLGLADQLASGPKSAAELADPMHVHAPSLYRLMRTLVSLGILAERTEQRFALTEVGEALKTGAPGSARSSVIFPAAGGFKAAGITSSTPFRRANLVSRRRKAWGSSTTSRKIQKRRLCSVRR